MRSLLNSARGERGSVIILIAAALAGLLAFGAISLDAGTLYAERTRLNNIADAAALAGATALAKYTGPTGGADEACRTAVSAVAVANGVSADSLVTEISGRDVTVRAASTVGLTFARVIDIPTANVAAGATAHYDVLTSVDGRTCNIVPIGVELDINNLPAYGTELKLADDPAQATGGNFHLLALGGTGAEIVGENFVHGYQGILEVGQEVQTEPGREPMTVVKGLTDRWTAGASFEFGDEESPCCLIMPVVSFVEVNGRRYLEIQGFAAYYLSQQPDKDGNTTLVFGEFIRIVEPDAGTGADPGIDFSISSVRLTR